MALDIQDLINKYQLNKKEFHNLFFHSNKNNFVVLVIHGLGFSLKELEFLFNFLKKQSYTVAIPFLPELCGMESENKDLFKRIEESFLNLSRKYKKVFLIGISFGSCLAISLAKKYPKKVIGLVTMEAPIFFKFKINLAAQVVRPLLQIFKINSLKKNRFLYRARYNSKDDLFPIVPLELTHQIFNYIKKFTRNELKQVKAPFLIIQAQKSDLIKTKSARYIYNNIQSAQKELYFLPINNHDLNLLDEKEKKIMLTKVHQFINTKIN